MDRNKNVETKNSQLDTFQSMLDAAGFVPGYGEPADLVNALISLIRGNKGEAAISAFSAIPILGALGSLKKGEKLFGNVKFRKTGPNESDYIIENRKDFVESLREPFQKMGKELSDKTHGENADALLDSIIDIYDPKNQGRAIGEIADEYLKRAPDIGSYERSMDDLQNIFKRLADSVTKKDLFDVFRRAGKN